MKYKRYTPGNSHTTKYRRTKYNANGTLQTLVTETVENWRFKKHYKYNKQDNLIIVKEKKIDPRSVYPDLAIEFDESGEEVKQSKKEQRAHKEKVKGVLMLVPLCTITISIILLPVFRNIKIKKDHIV
ncbi:hypothetical protein [Plebeiibacterium sediminum]|uniref:Uncharacterized protein n=1 Tax=Plebeiibacterium sediminum TaxID=2992112 RepID=A0AAE3M849_9BACT|nr:hypothetical protein [Plebeiobacterium sediminum]MCW3788929.1 hypothetical protein [Plebeiobacterium sediminum]